MFVGNEPVKDVTYRPEIDGLRAIAVLPVLLFHAGFGAFQGGFVGVDVFFVISGFLITKILLAELTQGTFSCINFYERRARRILPALFLVMFFCIPFAWLWLLPADLKSFSQSLVAVSLFSSNILFWKESGYFDSAAELKPLLHTWSLGVEEQYYVLFPLFMILFWKLAKSWIPLLLALLLFLSLTLAYWATYARPEAAFYLLPTRGWELLIGALAALYLSRANRKESSGILKEFAGWLGAVLIFFAIFTFSKETPFPGFYALIPTCGTVLVIVFATHQTTVGRLLSNRIFVSLGLISYSAYLWHQPIFAFARHLSLEEPSPELFILLVFLILLLAYLSWKFIEVPFRERKRISRKQIFLSALALTCFFVIIGLFGHFKNGFESRFERALSGDIGHVEFHRYIDENYFDCEPASLAESALTWDGFLRCKQSKRGRPEVVLLGDSHAEHLFLGLAEQIPGKNIAFYILGDKPYIDNQRFKTIFDELLSNGASQHVLLSMHFFEHLDYEGRGLYEGFSSSVKALLSAGKGVTLVGDVPRFNQDSGYCVYSIPRRSTLSCRLDIKDYSIQKAKYDHVLQLISSEFRIKYLTIDHLFCGDTACSMAQDNQILYRDNNHLNINGSRLVGKFIAEQLFF